jgi:hypothetical protein
VAHNLRRARLVAGPTLFDRTIHLQLFEKNASMVADLTQTWASAV